MKSALEEQVVKSPRLLTFDNPKDFEEGVVKQYTEGYGLNSWHPHTEQAMVGGTLRTDPTVALTTVFYALFWPLPETQPESRGIKAR